MKRMRKTLIVVDMQKDFIDGALGTKEAVAIVPYVKEVIENFDGKVNADGSVTVVHNKYGWSNNNKNIVEIVENTIGSIMEK